jgi:hemerythrin
MAIRWTPLLAVGVESIDSDHRVLFALANRLLEAMRSKDSAEVPRLLVELESFALEHFAQEESLMAEAGYPDMEEHRASHASLRCELAGLRGEHDGSGVTSVLAHRTNHFVCDWLLDHISGDDRALGSWLARLAEREARAATA